MSHSNQKATCPTGDLSKMLIKLSNIFLFVFVIICEISTSEVPRPRGVSLSRAPLYSPNKEFTCLDNSLTIPFSQVNDDYCDCPDASDEPGTAACPHGTFHCRNAGHTPLNIASSKVNDGICDCCDASDEYLTEKCNNNCKELGKSAKEEALRKAELLKAGKVIRAELSEKGIKLKQEKKETLVQLEAQKLEAEKVMKEKEQMKKEIEVLESAALEEYRKIEEENKKIKDQAEAEKNKIEATEAFDRFDSNKDGKLEIAELQSTQTFDKDRNGEVTVEEARSFLNEKDFVELDEFITNAWPIIKPFLMLDAGMFKPPAGVGHAEEVPLNNVKEVEEEYDENEPVAEEEEEEEPLDAEETEDVEEPTPTLTYDEETQNLVEKATQARSEFTEAEQAVRNIQSSINDIEEYLKKDFGPEESFAPLEGQCFEFTDYEYIYKLCPFDKATQQPKSGSVDTRLGSWSKWIGNNYDTMLYDRGQNCWNGPQRSVTVKVSCGSENKLNSVSEPNRCEYLYTFETPAACIESGEEKDEDVHDEL